MSPFDIVLDNNIQSAKVHNYTLFVSSNNSELKPGQLKLTVGDNYSEDLGYAHVLGEVTNQGTKTAKYAKVSGSFYNDQNQVVATDFTFTEPSDLAPGQSSPFDVVVTEHASAARYGSMSSGSLNVQSSEYAMILPVVVFKMSESTGGEVEGSTSGSNVDNNDGIGPG